MKNRRRKKIVYHFWSWLLIIMVGAFPAWAADGTANWRATYDWILMWVNFGILVFLFFKFARNPLKNFLKSRKNEIERQIAQLEDRKKEAQKKVKAMIQEAEESSARFLKLKNKIIEQGEMRKAEIIANARTQSKMMIEDTELKIHNQILQAREMLKSELIDTAAEIALEKLPKLVTVEDNRRRIQHFLARAGSREYL